MAAIAGPPRAVGFVEPGEAALVHLMAREMMALFEASSLDAASPLCLLARPTPPTTITCFCLMPRAARGC